MKLSTVLVALVTSLVLLSCNESTTWDKLELKKDRFYCKGSSEPFNGTAQRKFDFGGIATETDIRNGYIEGRWAAYGFAGEMIQEGVHSRRSIKSPNAIGVTIVSVATGREGDYTFPVVVYLGLKDSSRYNEADIRKRLLPELIEQKAFQKTDSVYISQTSLEADIEILPTN